MGSVKCSTGCVCKRHVGYSKPCVPGCSCDRHLNGSKRGFKAPWTSARLKQEWANPVMRELRVQRLRGHQVSKETREKIATGVAKYAETWTMERTPLELALRVLLREAGYEVSEQKRVGRYVTDAYDSAYNIAWEADGAYWHQDKDAEAVRDSYLLSRGLNAVIHLSERDLEPWGR